MQNIDLMNLAGFCRNCLSNWMKDAADAQGVPMTKDESREVVYGMPYEEWKAKHQKEASKEQQAHSTRPTSTEYFACCALLWMSDRSRLDLRRRASETSLPGRSL